MQDEASKIYQKMEESFREVTDLFHKVQEPDYHGTAELTNDILEERDEAGKLIRKSKFTDNLLDSIEEYKDKTKNILYFKDGKPLLYSKDFEELADGSWKEDIGLKLIDGKPSSYIKGFEKLTDNALQYDCILFFQDGKWERIEKE